MTDVIKLEREITMPVCVRSGLPNIQYEDRLFVAHSMAMLVNRYLESCYPKQVGEVFVIDIVEKLINKWQTWNIFDCVHFFKFIVDRQDLKDVNVMGNTITLQKILELSETYEDNRCEEVELVIREKQGRMAVGTRQRTNDFRPLGDDKLMGKISHEKYFKK